MSRTKEICSMEGKVDDLLKYLRHGREEEEKRCARTQGFDDVPA